jgi:hypothetical protein
MFDVLALVVLACGIVAAFALAVEPELICPGLCLQCDITVMRSCDADRLLLTDV